MQHNFEHNRYTKALNIIGKILTRTIKAPQKLISVSALAFETANLTRA